jgi:large subunit ribosomal protein L17
MLRNMVTSLFDKERITTTDAKAKEARRYAERLITRAKKGYRAYQDMQTLKDEGKEDEARQMQAVALTHWRYASRFVQNKGVLKKLFNDLAPLYIDRDGGYTRILRLGNRLGDNAQTVMLELVGTAVTSQPKVKKPRKKEEKEPEATEAAPETAAEEATAPEAGEKKAPEEAAAEEAKAEAAPGEAGGAEEEAADAAPGSESGEAGEADAGEGSAEPEEKAPPDDKS